MSPVALPAEILALICCDALQSGISPATLLTLNSHWHGATSSILYSCLAVPVSSVLLSTASGSTQEDYCSTGCVWLNRLLGKYGAITRNHKYAEAVKALYILPNDWPLLDEQAAHDPHVEASNTGSREIGSDLNDLGTSDLKIMTESQVVNLVKNYLTGIQSLSWLLPGPPSATFMAQLQNAQIRLLSVDIVTSPQVLLRNSTICSLDGYPATLSSSMTRGYPALRWDLACLQAFDVRHLVRLTLQNLSLEGIRTLGLLSSALIGCQELSLYNTLFVDDVLLSSVASAMQKLEILRIKHMAGTKLTSKGIAAIMEQCENLQEFELLDVQGRLSRTCWEDIDTYPENLRKVTIMYSENNLNSHSWTTDHLTSIAHLLERAKSLQTFQIGRVPLTVGVDGVESPLDATELPIALRPKALPDGFIATIMHYGKHLKIVNLDFWELTHDRLRTLLQTNPSLEVVQVLLDAPFSKLLCASSTSMSSSSLRTLTVSVTDRYLLELPCGALAKNRTRSTSLADMDIAPKTTRGRQSSVGHSKGPSVSSVEHPGAPALKDVKKFLKRFPHLSNLTWAGKGGVGSWKAFRCTAKDFVATFHPAIAGQVAADIRDGLLQLQAPLFGPILQSLGLSITKRTAGFAATPLDNAGLTSSATSSSIATMLSVSSSDTALSSLVTTVDASSKGELSPTARVHKALPIDSPIKSVGKSPVNAGGCLIPTKSNSKEQLHKTSPPVHKASAIQLSNASAARASQSAQIEKRIHRDGWAVKKSRGTKGTASSHGSKPLQTSKGSQKTAPLTEENLKQLKKDTQPVKGKATSAAAVPQQRPSPTVSGTADLESSKISETSPEGFALVSRSRKSGKRT